MNMREEFEAWVIQQGCSTRKLDESYADAFTRFAWDAWQEATATQLDVEKLARAICAAKGSLWYDGKDDAMEDAAAIIEELKK